MLILILGLSVSSCSDKEEVELPEPQIEMCHLQSLPATHISFNGDIKLSEVKDLSTNIDFTIQEAMVGRMVKKDTIIIITLEMVNICFFDKRMSTKGTYRQEKNNIIFDDLTMKGEFVDGKLFIVTALRAKAAEYLGVDMDQLIKVEIKEEYLKESEPAHLP